MFDLILDKEVGYIGDGFCTNSRVMTIFVIIGYILIVAKLVIPLIIVAVGTFDLYKVIIANEGKGDSLVKQAKTLGIRVAIGLLIFFVPTIVNAVFNAMANGDLISQDIKTCEVCLLDPANCHIDQE